MAEFLRKRQQIALDVLNADHDRRDDHAGIQQAIMLGIRERCHADAEFFEILAVCM